MTKTFKAAEFRKDRALIVFSAQDAAEIPALLAAICCNASTGYVRETSAGAAVPKHAAAKVTAHLEKMGWVAA